MSSAKLILSWKLKVYVYPNFTDNITLCNKTGDVRLTHFDDMDTIGRLEVCYDGHWGSVCIHNADDLLAEVVCRQLGYAANG